MVVMLDNFCGDCKMDRSDTVTLILKISTSIHFKNVSYFKNLVMSTQTIILSESCFGLAKLQSNFPELKS